MIRHALAVLAAPVAIPQAARVVRRAHRLPEAAGPRAGTLGTGPRLRLLICGDSSAAGVGVADQTDALAGKLTTRLATSHRVDWRLVARCGATAGDLAGLLRASPAEEFDIAVVAIGVNDAKNGHSRRRFRRDLSRTIELLRSRFGVRGIVVSGVPPLGRFPVLPAPLRWVLGWRASVIDKELKDLSARGALTHAAIDMAPDPASMAIDGFHPGARAYDAWAARLAPEVVRAFANAL